MSEVSGSESNQLSMAVLNAAAAGQKIEAIKILRAEQRLGLKQAKEIVDGLQTHARGSAPRMGAEDRGGFRLLVACVIVGSALAAFYLL